MARLVSMLACVLAVLACSSRVALADTVEHTFTVENLSVNRLCRDQTITAVNGMFPGPTLDVNEGDTLIVHVRNESPYDATIHWHGIFQSMTPWYDGPAYVTQCPIRPGQSYTYSFTITGQEGTLWWHAQTKWLRATVYGALIIRQARPGLLRQLLGPNVEADGDFPIILGEWWNANIDDIYDQTVASGDIPPVSDAFTINGQPGDGNACSFVGMYTLYVERGKKYLLRIINAALNNQLFFKIADHRLTVVAVDASYTNPYETDVVVLAPGQTVDAYLTADQESRLYYMGASSYFSAGPGVPFASTTTMGILRYAGTRGSPPKVPDLPLSSDTETAHKFQSSLRGYTSLLSRPRVPRSVDVSMFIAVGLGLSACDAPEGQTCAGPFGMKFAGRMNNNSFQFPTSTSMLEAFHRSESGIYTTDFPDSPPSVYNFTDPRISFDQALLPTLKSTKVKQVELNSVIEIVLQNTAVIVTESHPLHLHGFNFFVLAQGFGNYDPQVDGGNLKLYNPIERNTIAVPVGGWAVIRFKADNPGVWLFHSQLDMHLPMGLAMAFVVGNAASLPEPPSDLPTC